MMNTFIFNSSISFISKRSRLAKIAAPFLVFCGLFTFAAILLIGANAANAAKIASAQTAPAPHFTGDAIPEPPEQHAPWKVPVAETKNLDPHFVKAAEILFRQGLADPRGCEYREITIVVGSLYGENPWTNDGVIVKTHGWVLPLAKNDHPAKPANGDLHNEKKQPQRFAIAWNGLVYPVLAVGEKADVEKDAEEIIHRDNIVSYHAWKNDGQKNSPKEKQRRAKYEIKRKQFVRFGPMLDAKSAVQFGPPGGTHLSQKEIEIKFAFNGSNISLIRIALLLRLGKISTAQRMWKAWKHGTKFEKNPKSETTAAIYQSLATRWLFAQLRCAVCAQMRDDDKLTLLTLQKLAPLQKVANDELASLKKPPNPNQKKYITIPPFSFLDQVKALLVDQERRAHEPNRKILSLTAIKKIPNQSKRIAALIEHLDQIYAQQSGQPGGVEFGKNPTVQALIHEGDPAVEPLLRCLESDPRFTRSVHYWRDFAPYRTVMSVNEPAYTALTAILHKTFLTIISTGQDLTSSGWKGREKVATAMRVYWKKYGKLPLAERWFATLANDEATPDDWVQAAQDIVQPNNQKIIPSSMFNGTVVNTKSANHEPPQMAGESLRSKKNPSVSELLEKRIRELAEKPSNAAYNDPSTILNEVLVRWDGKENLKNLRWFSGVLAKRALTAKYKEPWIEPLSRLCLQRTKLGDPNALKEFAAFFKQCAPAKAQAYAMTDDVLALTKPMFENPANHDVQAALKWAFTNPKSSWLKAFVSQKNWQIMGDYLTTPLISMPPVRAFVLRKLANKSIAGIYAEQLSQLDGMPLFDFRGTKKERDKAVARCAQILRQYGAHYSYSTKCGLAGNEYGTWHQAIMHFAPLGHPATPDDVKAGRAIFSLPAKDHPHIIPLPHIPLTANWTAWKKQPTSMGTNTDFGKQITIKGFKQSGRIWQAEECVVNGKTERYYGFVRPGVLAEVPADEIEFPTGWHWTRLSNGFDCQFKIAGKRRADSKFEFTVSEPVMLKVKLRNWRGMDVTVPLAAFSDQAKEAKDFQKMRPAFVKIELMRLKMKPTKYVLKNTGVGSLKKQNWTPQKVKKAKYDFKPRPFKFTPREVLTVGEIRLDQCANLTPGLYYVRLKINNPHLGKGKTRGKLILIKPKR